MLVPLFRILFLAVIIAISGSSIYAQDPGDTLWTKYYGGDAYDEANAVVKGHDSGYVFVGYTQSYGLDRWGNAFIGKTLPSGDSIFTFHFGGTGIDVLTDVIHTSDGNYASTGFSDSEVEFEQLYIVKFNDEGDTLWTKTYGGSSKEIGYSILQTTDNGFIICGITSSTGAGGEDMWFLRTDSNGDTLWTKTYGTAGNDLAFGMCETSDGAYAVTGLIDYSTMMVMKINPSGDSLWLKTFGGNDFEEGLSILETDNTDLLALGHTSSFGAGELDMYLVRLTANGDMLFDTTYGSSLYDEGRDLIQLNSDEFIIAGNTAQNSGFMDYNIISIDGTGKINWSSIIGGQGPERCYDLLNNGDGNFVVAGSNSQNGELEDAALTLMMGDIQTGIGDDLPRAASYMLFDAYPNPFNPASVIRYSIPKASFVTLKVFDILGNEVAQPVNEFMNEGTYSVSFNSAEYGLSSGVYFYTLSAGNFVSTKKMILMK